VLVLGVIVGADYVVMVIGLVAVVTIAAYAVGAKL
jgi:hypothetical protein